MLKEYSPMDDSDEDPDYNPNNEETHGKRKLIPQYFKESDLQVSNETPPTKKKKTVIDYTDQSSIFRQAEKWEAAGTSKAEMAKILKRPVKLYLTSNDKNTSQQSIAEHEGSKQLTSTVEFNTTPEETSKKNVSKGLHVDSKITKKRKTSAFTSL